MAAFPDLSQALRNAIINGNGVTDLLGQNPGGDNVFTSRPVPAKAPYPMVVIGPDLGTNDQGGLNDQRLTIIRDVGVYGQNSGDTKQQYRDVETTARLVRDLFHRKPASIVVPDWRVVQIWTRGPLTGPTSNANGGTDDKFVARIVELTITLIAVI